MVTRIALATASSRPHLNSTPRAKSDTPFSYGVNLIQHVNGPAHKQRHTLDLIITRAMDELVIGTETRDSMLSDLSAVHCKLRLKKPPLEL